MANLTIEQISGLFVQLTAQLLNIDLTLPQNNDKIRQAYQRNGQPFQPVDQDVIYVYVLPIDDPTNKQIDTEYNPADNFLVNESKSYNRVISVQWVFYGPNCMDNAQKLRVRLFTQAAKNFYSDNGIKLITNVPEIRRVPELFQGRWWNRCDLSAQFNNRFIDSADVETIGTVNVSLNNNGDVNNITINES